MRADVTPSPCPLPHWGRGMHGGIISIPLPRRGGEGRVRGLYDVEDTFMKVLD